MSATEQWALNKIKEIEQQRDELLAALEAIRRGDDNPCHIASEAIAKAQGVQHD